MSPLLEDLLKRAEVFESSKRYVQRDKPTWARRVKNWLLGRAK